MYFLGPLLLNQQHSINSIRLENLCIFPVLDIFQITKGGNSLFIISKTYVSMYHFRRLPVPEVHVNIEQRQRLVYRQMLASKRSSGNCLMVWVLDEAWRVTCSSWSRNYCPLGHTQPD